MWLVAVYAIISICVVYIATIHITLCCMVFYVQNKSDTLYVLSPACYSELVMCSRVCLHFTTSRIY